MYIDGAWTAASDGATIDVIDPATEEVIDAVPSASAADLDRALAAADRAWKEWREVDAWTRSATLRRVGDLVRERAETIASVLTEEQGIDKANATEFGLAGYVFTASTRTAFLASEGIEAGMIGVNTLLLAAAEIPFGGVKKSGFGREGGSEGIEAYTIAKYVNIKL